MSRRRRREGTTNRCTSGETSSGAGWSPAEAWGASRPGVGARIAGGVDPLRRGSAVGARALIAAERRLAREGAGELVTRVPKTNGRGLYFMLRAGYSPVTDIDWASSPDDGATWFRRISALTPVD